MGIFTPAVHVSCDHEILLQKEKTKIWLLRSLPSKKHTQGLHRKWNETRVDKQLCMSDGGRPYYCVNSWSWVEFRLLKSSTHSLSLSYLITHRISLFFLSPLNQSEACKECVLNANDMVDDMEALEKTSQAFLYFKADRGFTSFCFT